MGAVKLKPSNQVPPFMPKEAWAMALGRGPPSESLAQAMPEVGQLLFYKVV